MARKYYENQPKWWENPTISADELLGVVGDYDALIVRGRTKVNPAVLAAGKKLKVVGRAGVVWITSIWLRERAQDHGGEFSTGNHGRCG